MTNQELIDFMGKTKHTVNSRIAELKKEKIIISQEKGKFQQNLSLVVEYIEILLEKLETKKII